MRNLPLAISLMLFVGGAGCLLAQEDKHRMVVLADMGNEPDEEEQMVNMIMYNNEFDIQGLIAVSGKYLHSAHRLPERTRLYPDLFQKIIDAYQKDMPNLEKHASGWPDPDYLRSIVKSGQADYGIAGIGPGQSSEGSEHIIDCLEKDDPRPLYVVVNAGSNTLAYSLWIYREAGTYKGVLELVHANSQFLSLELPIEAEGKEIHMILELRDHNPIRSMYDYRRVIVKCN